MNLEIGDLPKSTPEARLSSDDGPHLETVDLMLKRILGLFLNLKSSLLQGPLNGISEGSIRVL